MKQTKKTNKLLLVAFLSGLFVCAPLAVNSPSVQASATALPKMEWTGKVDSVYDFGASVELPEGYVTLNGKKYVANCVLYRPDGTATNATEVTLDCTGEYLLEYIASVDGKYVTEKKTFVVSNESLSVDGQGSVVYDEFNGVRGAKAVLQDGDKLVYNQVIDLNRFSDTDELFRMFAIPQTVGQEDFARFEVEIVDIHNADRKVILEAKQYLTTGINRHLYTYNNVKCGDSVFIGMEASKGGTIEFEGATYSLHKGDQYGAPIRYSFTGNQSGTNLGDEWIGVCYGVDNNVIRVKNQTTVIPVADLDSSVFLTDTFEGFTTGEVRVSIKPTNYVRSSCTLFLSHFAGKSVTENAFFIDTQASDLQLELDGYTVESLPSAIVGTPYKIFDATAFDINDGEVDVVYKVYYGYNNEHPISVNTQDGTFMPLYQGSYTIEYTATDRAGNVAKKLLQVQSVQRQGALALHLDNFQDTFVAGTNCKVIDGFSVLNGAGRASLRGQAILRDKPSVCYELDSMYAFTPLYSGVYDILFEFSDYHQTKTEQKTITVTKSDEVLFETNGVFPKYLLKNGVYEFPTVKTFALATGVPVEKDAQLYIIEDGKKEIAYENYEKVSAKESVVLRYKYSEEIYYEVEIPVKDAGLNSSEYRIKDYFLATQGQFAVGADANGVYFTIQEMEDERAQLQFVNPLETANFTFSMKPIVDETKVATWKVGAKFALYLQDSTNADNVLKFTYLVKENGVYLSVNNGKEYFVCESFANADDLLAISYSVAKGKAIVNERLSVTVATGLNGKPFTGFVGGVLLALDFEDGFTVGSGVAFTDLNAQKLTSTKYDKIAPSLVHNNSYYGEKKLNDIVEILPCYAYDVLTPDIRAYLQVLDPSGNPVRDEDGVLLDGTARADVARKVRLTQYGQYQFLIVAQDAMENPTDFPFTAYVIATEKPQVEIKTAVVKGQAGKSVSLANYTISGVANLDACTVFATVKKPDNTVEYVGVPTTYKTKVKGVYTVHISVIDEYGNLGEASFTLVIG